MFPTLAETAMDTLLDLVEEENDMVITTLHALIIIITYFIHCI